ncbi:MAG: hypothetical protein GSR79_04955 [Desulfurococcales archaeon]|nr:hypothetical protein [Desulfurococcales archaeon]
MNTKQKNYHMLIPILLISIILILASIPGLLAINTVKAQKTTSQLDYYKPAKTIDIRDYNFKMSSDVINFIAVPVSMDDFQIVKQQNNEIIIRGTPKLKEMLSLSINPLVIKIEKHISGVLSPYEGDMYSISNASIDVCVNLEWYPSNVPIYVGLYDLDSNTGILYSLQGGSASWCHASYGYEYFVVSNPNDVALSYDGVLTIYFD